ncbi:MAG: GT2 family glycosyltransferase [Candidatus Azotimanducaceae bacterium]
MKLSVVIVNYNVEHFLEQCLQSVFQAVQNFDIEVFVVDNNSVDGSMVMVKEKFPQAIAIENKDNLGFSKANNQAIRLSKGAYVLLLNPDTIVEEDTFQSCIDFMDAHPNAGGLGVKMIDGKGNFLPESKRALPTPAVAFYKIFGLSKLFPKSKRFGRYHLGHLSPEENHEIEILAGAFMLMRKSVLDKVGLLDEDYFMYGEDIDLSYRIILGGYKNYYFAESKIIHYKGESTKKGSLNYVFIFYNAMIIFAKKHFSQGRAQLFSFLIHTAIYLRAGAAITNRFVKRLLLPVIDFAAVYGGFLFLVKYWEDNHRYVDGGSYSNWVTHILIPVYILFMLLTNYFGGGYDKPIKLSKIVKSCAIGALVLFAVYGFIDEEYRFSRALMLLGAVWSVIAMTGLRFLMHLLKFKAFQLHGQVKSRVAIVGSKKESERVIDLLRQTHVNLGYIAYVQTNGSDKDDKFYTGTAAQLEEIVQIYKIKEVIFCSKDLSSQKIIQYMAGLAGKKVEIKIAPSDSLFVIGSNSINTQGELYTVNSQSIDKPENIRNKRVLDVFLALVLTVTFPLQLVLVKQPIGLLKNCFKVLFGSRSWVGVSQQNSASNGLKPGVILPRDGLKQEVNEQQERQLNLLYSKEYMVLMDLRLIFRAYRYLGRQQA